jgi:hypothetical protein
MSKRRVLQVYPSISDGGPWSVYVNGACFGVVNNKAALERALDSFQADFDPEPFGTPPEVKALRERIAELEKCLLDNRPDRPGWGASPLPNNTPGRVAAVLRRHYAADIRRTQLEKDLLVAGTAGKQFAFPRELSDLKTFGQTSLKTGIALAKS